MESIKAIATALDIPAAYLLGETDDSEPTTQKREVIELKNSWEAEMVKVPVYNIRTCAGYGTSHFLEDAEIIGERLLPAYRVGAISVFDDRKPFITIVEGDSMSEADIRDGDEIVINPAEDVHSGDVALVCYGSNKDTAVKWVYFLPGGGIEIRSATPGFPNIKFTKEQQESEESPVTIIGRVMAYTGVPKRG
jgi:phage repressor protein C with HTH and peptisase S24 domain